VSDRPLRIDPETMRRLGYRTVDMLVERLADQDAPLIRRASREEMEARLHRPPPEEPTPYEEVLERLERDVLPFTSRGDHPGFMAYIPSCPTWPGALGDLVASALNVYAGAWMDSAGPSQLELTVLDWFRRWIGYPEDSAGILVSGGSAANMTALACAREALLGAMSDRVVIYVSDQAHSSLARAARVLGFRPDQVRVLPSDRRFRLRPELVADAMEADRREGRRPFLVGAAAGSTNTGAIDPLGELADLCAEEGAWLHVDAAYGGFAALTDRGREALRGIERADSVTLDPHKWLFQPFECGSVLVRRGHLLGEAFTVDPDYLKDAEADAGEVNFSDLGMQLTRMSRSLKLWMSLNAFGVSAFRNAIDRAMDLASLAQERIEERDELELLSPAGLGIVCFRRRFPGGGAEVERRNAALVPALERTGRALISSTRLHGTYALRLCILNDTTRAEDVRWVIDWLAEADAEDGASADHHGRHAPMPTAGWGPDADRLRDLEVCEGLTEDQLASLAGSARTRTAPAGTTLVARWESSREFYVVLEGEVSVEIEGAEVARLGAGRFFGELAALDWGAEYGYPRLATVSAATDVRLLEVPPARFNELFRGSESFAARIRAAIRERLPTD